MYSPTEAFDLFETDPRAIDADLEKVSIGWDPRAMLCLWQQMESKFQIRHSWPVEYQVLVTAPPYGQVEQMVITTRADADKFLQFEENLWRSYWEVDVFNFAEIFNKDMHPDSPENLKKAQMSVIGFWLFPVEAFGNVPDEHLENEDFKDIRWDMKLVLDLSKHRPQLGTYHLPLEG